MKISEIFYSLQGEGVYQGEPTIFVRMQGCNLKPPCGFCDTPYAQNPDVGKEVLVSEVVKRVLELRRGFGMWVCITGGEPLNQPLELRELVLQLKPLGYRISMETNGSIKPPNWYGLVDSWSADIKCPSSGVSGASLIDWLQMRSCDQVKFVVSTLGDLKFVEELHKRAIISPKPVWLISPASDARACFDMEWVQEVVEFCRKLGVRFSLQWHKIIWENKRGV